MERKIRNNDVALLHFLRNTNTRLSEKPFFGLLLISSLAGCGSNPTQYSTPDNYRVALNVAGTGVDRLKELSEGLSEGLSGADGEGIEIASGMSADEETALAGEISDALADALAELV